MSVTNYFATTKNNANGIPTTDLNYGRTNITKTIDPAERDPEFLICECGYFKEIKRKD